MNISVPDKVKKEVQESLRDLQKPSKLDKSPLGSSCIVAKYHQENLEATKALALKEVLTKILSLLEKEAPDHVIDRAILYQAWSADVARESRPGFTRHSRSVLTRHRRPVFTRHSRPCLPSEVAP